MFNHLKIFFFAMYGSKSHQCGTTAFCLTEFRSDNSDQNLIAIPAVCASSEILLHTVTLLRPLVVCLSLSAGAVDPDEWTEGSAQPADLQQRS